MQKGSTFHAFHASLWFRTKLFKFNHKYFLFAHLLNIHDTVHPSGIGSREEGSLCMCLRRAKNGGVSGYMGGINHPWRRIYHRGAVSVMSAVRQTATWQPWPKWGWGGRDDRTESHETGRTELTRFVGSWAAQRTDRYTTVLPRCWGTDREQHKCHINVCNTIWTF